MKIKITGFENFEGRDDYFVFHAGTKYDGDDIVTNGGRVLGITNTAQDLKSAVELSYQDVKKINFERNL
mgnify:CR=1 FL=1